MLVTITLSHAHQNRVNLCHLKLSSLHPRILHQLAFLQAIVIFPHPTPAYSSATSDSLLIIFTAGNVLSSLLIIFTVGNVPDFLLIILTVANVLDSFLIMFTVARGGSEHCVHISSRL